MTHRTLERVDTCPAPGPNDALVTASRRLPARRLSSRATWVRLARNGLIVLTAYLVVGNAAILGASLLARWQAGDATVPSSAVISNFRVVDAHVWRGAAPGSDGLVELAGHGVTTIVDLRAEHDLDTDDALIAELGLERFHLPIRDGQLPTAEQAARFLEIVDQSSGPVFLHCGAGVGRTGAVVAHYLAATGQASGWEALGRNLSVGPPSLEQIVFAFAADGTYDRPGPIVTGLSRVLDAPRRIWHNLT